MLSDVQRRKIVKYRKLANKNVICKYLAIVAVATDVIVVKFFTFHKRSLVVLTQLCVIVSAFLLNTSFAPPTFEADNTGEMMVAVEDVEVIGNLLYLDNELVEQLEDDYAADNKEDAASLDDLIEKSKETAGISLQSGTVQIDNAVFDKNDWKLLLINKQHTIPEDYEFTLGIIKGSMRCDERIIEPLTQMFAAAKNDGVNLVVRSPYRDMKRQEYLFERKVKGFQAAGMSYMDAYKKASVTVTVPGASEHQVGLAVDITSDVYSGLETGFADTEGGKWLATHSWEYGFILRYPLGKESVTGIQFEPWHFRYVGVEAAEVITKQNITLEEFVENL